MNLLNLTLNIDFIYMQIRVTTSIIFASLGAVVCTRVGVVNLELEGIVLTSALAGVFGSVFGGNLVQGAATGTLAAVAVNAVFVYFHLILKANNVLCGTTVNTMISGLTVSVLQLATGEEGNFSSLESFVFPNPGIPVIKDTPVIGSVLSGHNSLTYVALVMVAVIWLFLYKIPTGLHMKAVGGNPNAASSVGQNAVRIQFPAIVLCGLMTGLGGTYLSMGYLNMSIRDMTAGRGFISLAACSMEQTTPVEALLSSMIPTFFDGFSNIPQVLKIPFESIQMLLYLAVIAGFTVYSIQKLAMAGRKIERLKEIQG